MSLSPSMSMSVLLKCRACTAGSVEGSILARAGGCKCEEFRLVGN